MNDYRNLTDNKNVLDYLYNLMLAKDEYLDAAFDEMIRLSGSTNVYLNQILQVSDKQLKRLQELYLE